MWLPIVVGDHSRSPCCRPLLVVGIYHDLFVLSGVDGIGDSLLFWVLTNIAAGNILVRVVVSIGTHVGGDLRCFAGRDLVSFMFCGFGSPYVVPLMVLVQIITNFY